MHEEDLLQINVREIIRSKKPKTYKKIPAFIIRYLERILHQDEINSLLRANPHTKDLEFVDVGIKFLELSIDSKGLENIPNTGRFVFAANHPLGGMESLVLMQLVAQKHKNLVFVVNDLLMSLRPLSGLFIPVNKLGGQSRESVKKINDAYNSDKQILFFPAGLVSRKKKGKIEDPPWQKSFVSKAVETKRDIIPVFIAGKNSNFFYRLANFRKFFGIKANIEMLYLVNEMFKQRGQTIKITFGKPIPYKTFDKSKSYKQWAEYLKKEAYLLGQKKSL